MLTDTEVLSCVEEICNWLEREPSDLAEGGRSAVLNLLRDIEPRIRERNLSSDFELTASIVKEIKPGSRPRQETLDRAYRAAYGMKISVGSGES